MPAVEVFADTRVGAVGGEHAPELGRVGRRGTPAWQGALGDGRGQPDDGHGLRRHRTGDLAHGGGEQAAQAYAGRGAVGEDDGNPRFIDEIESFHVPAYASRDLGRVVTGKPIKASCAIGKSVSPS